MAPLGMLYEVMAAHGTPAAALRALTWAGATTPQNESLVMMGLQRALNLDDGRRVRWFAADAARFLSHSYKAITLAARALDRFGGDARRLARVAMVLSPEAYDDMHLLIWRYCSLPKDASAVHQTIERWKTLCLGDRVYRCACDTAFVAGDVRGFVSHVLEAMDRRYDLFNWQHRLAQLSSMLSAVWSSKPGIGAALAAEIVRHPFFPEVFTRASRGREITDAALGAALEDVEDHNLRAGLQALLDHEFTKAVGDFSQFAASGAEMPNCLGEVVPEGPDVGHPLWHVANPFFRIWVESWTEENTQENWRLNPILGNQPSGTPGERYAQWLSEPLDTRGFLSELVQKIGGPDIKALDLGCGFGEWLRFLADHQAVSINNLFGVDYHQSRVEATRDMLADAVAMGAYCLGDPLTVLAGNIQQRDLTRESTWKGTSFRDIDLVTMFVVTGVFEDAQLERVLEGLAELSPRYVFVTTVTRRWRLWHGRPDEKTYFERNGFREIRRHWLPEVLPSNPGMALLAPKRYWTNTSLHIYSRI
ncbi:MAG: class I SAM-dependent methyltransferase [Alphaproteobacteria bacterium]|nr:class I SAM-dependent methyltransferase [Alphaproteobacteria bacterium]